MSGPVHEPAAGEPGPTIWSDETGPEDAPLVVLIHGSMDRSAGMLKVARLLDGTHRVLRYDRRGYGRSAPHEGPFGMGGQVADLRALLHGRAAVLIGHSYGGNVALAVAAHHPDSALAVAVYETPLSWEPWWPGSTAGAQAVATQGTTEQAAERFMRRLIGDERWEALPERTRETRRREGAAMVGELSDLRLHRPWSPEHLRLPVLAAYGTRGAAHHRRGMEHVAASVEGATLVAVDGCGHDAPFREPGRFVDAVVAPLLGRRHLGR